MTHAFHLTTDQRDQFEREGVVRLPGFVEAAAIAAMAGALWRDLEARLGARRDAPETWTMARPAHFQALIRNGAFDRLDTPAMRGLADVLLGPAAQTAERTRALPLVTFPSPQFDLPQASWHFDLPGDAYRPPLPGLRLFVILERLAPRGGGTLYVAGAHRLALAILEAEGRSLPSAALRRRLKAAHPWFERLLATPGGQVEAWLDRPARVEDIEVCVREMTGEAGDLILMHPLMLHGLAHNAGDRPRLMLTMDIWRQGQTLAGGPAPL
jgi:hypothetical protein